MAMAGRRGALRIVRCGPRDALPIWEQLHLEEALYRDRSKGTGWCILNHPRAAQKPTIVLGYAGKIEKLVNEAERAKRGVGMLRRFTGGGTVVVDPSTVFASWLLDTTLVPGVKAFPRSIMDWSGGLYGQVMGRVGVEGFTLRADDYVVHDVKVAGNAQAISGDKWVHHTSFLWDFEDELMQVLQVPEKQPDYRANRDHTAFLQRLREVVPTGGEEDEEARVGALFDAIEATARDVFEPNVVVEHMSLEELRELVAGLPDPGRKRSTRWEQRGEDDEAV